AIAAALGQSLHQRASVATVGEHRPLQASRGRCIYGLAMGSCPLQVALAVSDRPYRGTGRSRPPL
ncbi:hypothetical protein GW17_00024495, partial [Ensete ventricosum]